MKKQINPTIKAHLIRGAFYLLLLLAVCAIPFALAQRNKRESNQSVGEIRKAPANDGADQPTRLSEAFALAHRALWLARSLKLRETQASGKRFFRMTFVRGSDPASYLGASSKDQWRSCSAHNPDSASTESSAGGAL